ncbi:MAG: GH36-type glycosyl hydrolase domain-containing protein [Chloroflexota bacterium]
MNDAPDRTPPPPTSFQALAARLAEEHHVTPDRKPAIDLPGEIDGLETLFSRIYEDYLKSARQKAVLSSTAEWLLDNHHVIYQALRQVRQDLPMGFYRRLPTLENAGREGHPRVYDLARAVIAHTEAKVEVSTLQGFLQAYQESHVLRIGELWAFPAMLRWNILFYLAHVVLGLSESDLNVRSIDAPAIRLPEDVSAGILTGNCIRGLRTIATQDWNAFFEQASVVENVLRTDPAGVYARMDFKTRDRYRKAIEALAQATGKSEVATSQEAIRQAQESPRLQTRYKHVGYWLIGAGQAAFKARIGYRPAWAKRAKDWGYRHATLLYPGAILLLTVLLAAGFALGASRLGFAAWQAVLIAFLSLAPASMLAVNLANSITTHLVPVRTLPAMDFEQGIPAAYQTMVVVPALLTNQREIDFLLKQLERHFLANPDRHLYFALLGDFSDAPEAHMPDDEALLEHARQGIARLNEDHAGRFSTAPFYLFHRRRQWNASERRWMGWERKRGKLHEFNRLLSGNHTTSFDTQVGDTAVLAQIRFVITLDADTIFPPEAARKLVGAMAHPLNEAEFDPDTNAVIDGYTVLQPRVSFRPSSTQASWFARSFSEDYGVDLYSHAVSDVYQDVFGEGLYMGKGIYDPAAFMRSQRDCIPENSLLSHDLFEGVLGRAGLLTTVVLYEDYPQNYLLYVQRQHRWMRGDWQLLPWVLPGGFSRGAGTSQPSCKQLSALGRWKIFDNLRRSLEAPALLALLLAGWLWIDSVPFLALWTLIVLAIPAIPLIVDALSTLLRGLRSRSANRTPVSVHSKILRWLFTCVFLPYASWVALDAIATTLVRIFITRRSLLEWTTYAHTMRLFKQERKVAVIWSWLFPSTLPVAALLLVLFAANPPMAWVGLPLISLWLFSPAVAWFISQPTQKPKEQLHEAQVDELRRLARNTWLFFEHFVGPEDHWLPPDHFQEYPLGVIAHRTSPTNIGLSLVSTLCAYELGYIGAIEISARLHSVTESLDRLEKYRGHYLNWYETHQLQPLNPRYVSTVDSGNLAASLWTLRQGLKKLPGRPIFRPQSWQGLGDTLQMLRQALAGYCPEEEDTRQVKDEQSEEIRRLCTRITDFVQELSQMQATSQNWRTGLAAFRAERWQAISQNLERVIDTGQLRAKDLSNLRLWSGRIEQHLFNMTHEVDRLMPWLAYRQQAPAWLAAGEADPAVREAWEALNAALIEMPALDRLAEAADAGKAQAARLCERIAHTAGAPTAERLAVQEWCRNLQEAFEAGSAEAQKLLRQFEETGRWLEKALEAMDFTFLYNPFQKVFHLGYNVSAEQLDANHYDLLASEARTASLVAIAKNEVPVEHWLHLNRPMVHIDGVHGLLSWNGSMFEYLMPDLLVKSYPGSLLHETNQGVIQRQMQYAARRNVPWGISESGYYSFDNQQNYQYQGFGVPGLGRKRNLAKNLVIAPYASLLALPLRPAAVMENLQRLKDEQALGQFGCYEAIDYTPTRLPLHQKQAIVRSYMVHHQGMILSAITNTLLDNVLIHYFHQDARAQIVELLLQERVPLKVPTEAPPNELSESSERVISRASLEAWEAPTNAPWPQAQYLSNGRYSVLLTESGGGFSRCVVESAGSDRAVALTRWRADSTRDDWGCWIYVQDRQRQIAWSATAQPFEPVADQEKYQVKFWPHQVEFQRREADISLRTEVIVAPEDSVEIRRLTLTNHSPETRALRLTSYGEVVLAPQATDRQHPAFNKLFIESEYLHDGQALLFSRRPRGAHESPLYLAHFVSLEEGIPVTNEYETDRRRFVGRGQTPRTPRALQGSLSQTTGGTLDPIFSVRQDVTLKPYASMQLAFVTLLAESREETLLLAQRYKSLSYIGQTFQQVRTIHEAQLGKMGDGSTQLRRYQQLLSALVYPNPALRAGGEVLAANRRGQPGLWPFSISGDYPILLVKIDSSEEIGLVNELVRAHRYWRKRQFQVDLVILNAKDRGYAQDLQNQLLRLLTQLESETCLNRRGGIFLLMGSEMDPAAEILLASAARVVFDAKDGLLQEQLKPLLQRETHLPKITPSREEEAGRLPAQEALARPQDLQFDNGLGGFSPDGREYVIYLDAGQWTPAAWSNVIANPEFGFLTTEAGLGFSWAINSGENRLSPWHNDPLQDPPAEALYLRDEETTQIWTPTPLPVRGAAPYLVRHGAGYTIYEHHSHAFRQTLKVFAAPDAAVKVVELALENTADRPRRVTATYYVEWVLGTHREQSQSFIIPEYANEHWALLARNTYNTEFEGQVAFLAGSQRPHGVTTDRREFIGRLGDLRRPEAITRLGLTGKVAAGLDPCAAMQLHIDLAPREECRVFFLIGRGAGRKQAIELIERYQNPERVQQAWEALRQFWDGTLGAVTVKTPDPAMDTMLNRWLLYQDLACRIWGRSAGYQSSGAYGFRDQLQDVMALLYARPADARRHILRAARHQFEEGDVLHWWHPPTGRGVRTHIKDDLLWLPYVAAFYIRVSGDTAILHEEIPFLQGERLKAGEHERYGQYAVTEGSATLYEHCRRAIVQGSSTGPHGLPLIGAGDWNDGMNRVGIEGRGESVWLGWFLYAVLQAFIPLCEAMEEAEQAVQFRQQAERLKAALQESAWDGAWYRRAYFDDGHPLGSTQNDECQIDSIAQSWAVLSGGGEAARDRQAMQSVAEKLLRIDDRLLLLFTPPFDQTGRDPGYIKGYLPGIRENGGQYTHAAIWAAWAFAGLGHGDRAGQIYGLLNPIYHSDSPEKAGRYTVEPYVIAADVYSAPAHIGHGGWTWYTGSGGWMYRLGLEAILGLRKTADALSLAPCIPQDWKGFEIHYRYKTSVYHIRVVNPRGVSQGIRKIVMDGERIEAASIPLRDDNGSHVLDIEMG